MSCVTISLGIHTLLLLSVNSNMCSFDFVFKIRLIRLGFSFKKTLKILIFELTIYRQPFF